ncbi:MAG: gamma-butyrobetaine hydroxylase-like domain-containing protein [Verrucomicrobiota bacterium]
MRPSNLQVIGNELAIVWQDGSETYLHAEQLREHSPSAENVGEVDILGQRHGGEPARKHPGVGIRAWHAVGNYAIRIEFTDGHRTGIFSWDFLRKLDERLKSKE